jgi:hypothetical protein
VLFTSERRMMPVPQRHSDALQHITIE